MKILKKYFKLTALVLGILILLQSCRVYQHRSVSLKTAFQEGRRVKIKAKDQQVYKFDRIIFEKEFFYGIKKKRKKLLKMELNPNELESIRMHNKTMSIIYGIGVTYLATLTVGVVLLFCCSNIGSGIGGGIRF